MRSRLITLWLISLAMLAVTGVNTQQTRQDLLTREAREADAQDAGVIMIALKDRWNVAANLNGISEDAVSNAMEPDFDERARSSSRNSKPVWRRRKRTST